MFRRCYPHGDLKIVSLRSSNLAAKMSSGTAICNRNRGKGSYKPGKTDTVERRPQTSGTSCRTEKPVRRKVSRHQLGVARV